jgi:hypothetical protein
MKESYQISDLIVVDPQFPQECIPIVLKYLDLRDVMIKMMPLSRAVRELVITENYIIFKQFLRFFTLSQRLKKTDIPAKVNIMQLIKDNVDAMGPSKIENLMPFSYYTDGGSYNDDHYYFLHNIF